VTVTPCHPEERSDVRICKQKYKPIHIKMADFKDEIPIIYQMFCVNFANREKLHIFAES